MEIKERIERAEQTGRDAFKAGKSSIPCQDRNLLDLLQGLQVGQGGVKIISAWTKGWHSENLKGGY